MVSKEYDAEIKKQQHTTEVGANSSASTDPFTCCLIGPTSRMSPCPRSP